MVVGIYSEIMDGCEGLGPAQWILAYERGETIARYANWKDQKVRESAHANEALDDNDLIAVLYFEIKSESLVIPWRFAVGAYNDDLCG
ncbi:hypothetical protein PRIPAC_84302 [Pristionchus pacificus]|uniref:Uncharacterized protein n=1 Tax=Pristionchus pacificus TaxID=54126 RepID=A0A2A6BV63_PRIPA|nr:hypothetical protein PRIPAC_84302 [Pristionchus pacificus]|eukprot:PDM69789.1 hypothetical protein PRIPAC_44885 [Pristionchus pacificus]